MQSLKRLWGRVKLKPKVKPPSIFHIVRSQGSDFLAEGVLPSLRYTAAYRFGCVRLGLPRDGEATSICAYRLNRDEVKRYVEGEYRRTWEAEVWREILFANNPTHHVSFGYTSLKTGEWKPLIDWSFNFDVKPDRLFPNDTARCICETMCLLIAAESKTRWYLLDSPGTRHYWHCAIQRIVIRILLHGIEAKNMAPLRELHL